MLAMTNDGLLTYRRVGGAAGLQIVPDLAVAMPTVGDGGRSYTFQLRRGIRYSNGGPVRASDFRYALERQLSPAALSRAGLGYYQDVMFSSIVGYAACRSHPATCSFRNGVQTDDRTGTITIHLTQPDATLPQKLATTFGDLVPPGSPAPDSGKPVPATGPYIVSTLTHHGYGGVLLVRNPYFHQWSADAQPAGYPDRIRWVFTKDTAAELSAVEQGRADVMIDGPPPDRFSELTTRYATLAHLYASLSTTYLALNTRVAPFDRLAARQAVNLAVDRRRVVAALGGPLAETPTCQVLPPGMFGYAPYCPYTANPTAAGTWSGPDLARARRLVDVSGTRGQRVVVWAWGGSHSLPALPYLVHALDQLGYRASSHVTSPDGAGFGEANAATSDSRRHIAASLGGWAADYPNPIDYLDLLLSCHAFTPNSESNLNTSEFCNATSDALVQAAEAVQTTGPGSRLLPLAEGRPRSGRPGTVGTACERHRHRRALGAGRQLPAKLGVVGAARSAVGAVQTPRAERPRAAFPASGANRPALAGAAARRSRVHRGSMVPTRWPHGARLPPAARSWRRDARPRRAVHGRCGRAHRRSPRGPPPLAHARRPGHAVRGRGRRAVTSSITAAVMAAKATVVGRPPGEASPARSTTTIVANPAAKRRSGVHTASA